MKSSLHFRLMIVITPTLILAAIFLGFLLRQQTVSHFVVYLSSREQLQRLPAQDRFLLRFYADRIAGVLPLSHAGGIERIVDTMADEVGRQIVVARNDEAFFLSRNLRDSAEELLVNDAGVLFATVREAGVTAELELSPVVTEEITPFTVTDNRSPDVARVYALPPLQPARADSEARFVTRTTRTIVLLTAAAALVMILLIAVVVTRSLRPIRELTRAAHELRRGELPAPISVAGAGEIGELTDAFNRMAREIRETDASRRRLLTDVSHELRGPLANLRSQIEAMEDGLLPADSAGLESLHEETMLLARLVDDLHELTLADTQSLRLEAGAVEPARLVDAAVTPLRPALRAQEIDLVVDAPRHLPAVYADEQRMGQVLRNVLQNALRYAPGGAITVTASERDGRVAFSIADTGVGIREEDLERIFERFYRPDPSRSRASGGSGLGLAIARALVHAHGGEIFAEANSPQGLVVTIMLPAANSSS